MRIEQGDDARTACEFRLQLWKLMHDEPWWFLRERQLPQRRRGNYGCMHFTCWSLLYSGSWSMMSLDDLWGSDNCLDGEEEMMEADASPAFLFYCVSTGRHLGWTIRERGPWLFFIVRPLSLDDLLGSDNCINGEKEIVLNMHFIYWSRSICVWANVWAWANDEPMFEPAQRHGG